MYNPIENSIIGMFMIYPAARRPGAHDSRSLRSVLILVAFSFTAHAVLEVDLPDGHICLYGEKKAKEIAYMGFSLLFGERFSVLHLSTLLTPW